MNSRTPFHLSHPFPVTYNGGKVRLEAVLSGGCYCGGATGTLTKRQKSGGIWVVALQCDKCGCAKGNGLRKSDFQGFESLPIFDEKLSKRYENYQRESWQTKREIYNSDWRRRYDEFLRSREWYNIRDAVIARDGGVCQACMQTKEEYILRVHHLTYSLGFAPPLYLLVTVCIDCHDRLHADKHGLEDLWCPQPLLINH